MFAPLRRSSRIRRAPVKCVCATCVTSRGTEEHLSSTNESGEDLDNRCLLRDFCCLFRT
jgi:hypothetical protein